MKSPDCIQKEVALALLLATAAISTTWGVAAKTDSSADGQSVGGAAEDAEVPAVDADRRGESEAVQLRDELIEQTTPTTTDPSQALPPEEPGPPVLEAPKKRLPLILYASIRVHLVSDGTTTSLEDGASRVGLLAAHKLPRDDKVIAMAELGFNVVDQFSALITPDASASEAFQGNTFNPRLYYAGYERGLYSGLVGKNWSPYYAVAGMTDRFGIFGGLGAGVYNAGTDGGGSGTGRADHALQLRLSHDELNVGLQAQARTDIPTFSQQYDYGLGAAVQYMTDRGIELGAAYNRAVPEDIDQTMRAQGFDGDDEAWALAARFSQGPLLGAVTYARSRNHETDEAMDFFNAEGVEVYSRWNILPVLRAVAGWNYLRPRDGDYQGARRTDEYIVGIHYTFHRKTFEDMVYAEYRFDEGRLGSGEPKEDVFAIGVRYKFTW